MDLDIVKLRNNLNTFTLHELKKEVIRMKQLNFVVTSMKRNQVIELIINFRFLFPHLLNKTGTKRQPKPNTAVPPPSIKLPPELLRKLANQIIFTIYLFIYQK